MKSHPLTALPGTQASRAEARARAATESRSVQRARVGKCESRAVQGAAHARRACEWVQASTPPPARRHGVACERGRTDGGGQGEVLPRTHSGSAPARGPSPPREVVRATLDDAAANRDPPTHASVARGSLPVEKASNVDAPQRWRVAHEPAPPQFCACGALLARSPRGEAVERSERSGGPRDGGPLQPPYGRPHARTPGVLLGDLRGPPFPPQGTWPCTG